MSIVTEQREKQMKRTIIVSLHPRTLKTSLLLSYKLKYAEPHADVKIKRRNKISCNFIATEMNGNLYHYTTT